MLSITPINHGYYDKPVSFKAKPPESNFEPETPKTYSYAELYALMNDLAISGIEEQDIIPPPKETINSQNPAQTEPEELETLPLKNGFTELHSLCLDKDIEGAKKFIKEHPNFDVNQHTGLGSSYIFIAAYCIENEELANIFAGNKSLDLNKFNTFGYNDLHTLCAMGYKDAVQKVIDNHPGLDIYQLTKAGVSYIDIAKQHGHIDIVKIFKNLCPTSKIDIRGIG